MPGPVSNLLLQYKRLALSLLLALAFFTLARLIFFAFNASWFPTMSVGHFFFLLWGGLRFDVTAVLYLNVLFIFLLILPHPFTESRTFNLILKVLFISVNAAALVANLADVIYYRFTLRRTTADIFQQFSHESNIGRLVVRFLFDYWYMTLIFGVLLAAMIYLYNRIDIPGRHQAKAVYHYGLMLAFVPLSAYLYIGAVRGGFRHSTRPITLSNAGAYVNRPEEVNIVLNTPFSVFRTLGKTKIQRLDYYTDSSQLNSTYSPVHHRADSSAFRPDNVVVIILESFSREFVGYFNKEKKDSTYQGYTPFLDSLATKSLTFSYSFANGRKSIDAVPSVTCAIPSLGVPYVLTPFASNKVNSLASLLKTKGYYTSFFHGAADGSMGFEAFTHLSGYDHYYGMSEYNNDADFDGMWGIWDEPFFQYFGKTLNTFPQPFLTTIFSVSSHHPFKIPDQYAGRFKGGSQPIEKCIQYTDFSLKQFFNEIKTMPWYQHTLFVFTADHTSSNIEFDESRTAWGLYSIPIMFFKPDNSLARQSPQIVQQSDILPSILGYLHYDKDYVAFGRNVFEPNSEPLVFNYNDAYQLFEGDYLLIFNGDTSTALYDYVHDRMLSHNLLEEETDKVQQMQRKVEAILQQYNNRMIDNQLTVEP